MSQNTSTSRSDAWWCATIVCSASFMLCSMAMAVAQEPTVDQSLLPIVESLESSPLPPSTDTARYVGPSQTHSDNDVTIKVGGMIHIDSTLFPTSSPGIGFFENPSSGADPENRLEFRRLRVEASGTIREMFYKLDFEFSNPNDPRLLDAYFGIDRVPGLGTVIFGNQVRPLGFDVLTSGSHTVFMESPLLYGETNVDSRRIGVLSRGHSEAETLNWQIGLFEVPDLQSTGNYVSDSLQFSLDARVSGTTWYDAPSGGRYYSLVGANTSIANAEGDAQLRSRPELRSQSRWIDTGEIANSDWVGVTGLEFISNRGRFSTGGELSGIWVEREAGLPSTYFHGGYVFAGYFLTDDFLPLNRTLGVLGGVQPTRHFVPGRWTCGDRGAWQVAARVSYFDLTDQGILGGRQTNLTLGLNWWFNPQSRFMFNYVVGNIDQRAPVGGFTGGHFSGLAMRMQFDF